MDTSYVDNKMVKKSHGEMLSETAHALREYLTKYPDAVLVREKALVTAALNSIETIGILHKVVGVSDLYAWGFGQKEFQEISPITIKALIGGERGASKDQVAEGLEPYVGKYEYTVDDESDAVAVGVAWLISNKYLDRINKPKVFMMTEEEILSYGSDKKKPAPKKKNKKNGPAN